MTKAGNVVPSLISCYQQCHCEASFLRLGAFDVYFLSAFQVVSAGRQHLKENSHEDDEFAEYYDGSEEVDL